MAKQSLLPSVIASKIKRSIIEQNLSPGTKLPNETSLLELYGVSRPTLREAVKILITENIIEIRRGKGTFVTNNLGIGQDPLGLEFSNQKELVKSLYETRLLIEPPIARLAALRRDEVDLEELRQALNNFSKVFDGGENHAIYDIAFHTAIARCSKNDVLFRILPIINEGIWKGLYETHEAEISHKRAMVFHNKLFDAIKQKDCDRAEKMMHDHIFEASEDANVVLTLDFNSRSKPVDRESIGKKQEDL